MIVAADLRTVQYYNLGANESLLASESTLVSKSTEALTEEELSIGERTNLAYISTSVATHSGQSLVYAAAKTPEVGKIGIGTIMVACDHLNIAVAIGQELDLTESKT
uniref:Sodium transport ATPase 5 n=1 Tax=Eufriesea mexicana TaxID=516756 RepID=A0A310SLE4_9HYME